MVTASALKQARQVQRVGQWRTAVDDSQFKKTCSTTVCSQLRYLARILVHLTQVGVLKERCVIFRGFAPTDTDNPTTVSL